MFVFIIVYMSDAYRWVDPDRSVTYRWDGGTTITSEVIINSYKVYTGKITIDQSTAESMDRIQDFIVGYTGPPLGMSEDIIEQIESENPGVVIR